MKTQLPSTIYVAVVEDDEVQRNSLQWLIESSPGFACTGVYANCQAALEGVRSVTPDVVLMDIGLGAQSGIQCVRALKGEFPSMNIVMQTVYSDDEMIFESLRAGAVGYLLKKAPTDKMLQAIREANDGGAPMSGEVARKVMHFFQEPQKDNSLSVLSERETEVLQELIRGHSYQAIADRLYISVNTVRFHVKNIYEKLHVKSRPEAIAKALKEKLL